MSLYQIDLPAHLQLLIADGARVADHAQPLAAPDCTAATANTDERCSIVRLPPAALLHLSLRMR